ncbi:MAG TPA: YkgJ family cysteine cluster protein [Pyrinomonadaceae bacterium]|jgi:Fe-S-cluster containining protein|nr:YkgJ family cysteine cluster protein [Pyrinomonadaceae bacterium]
MVKQITDDQPRVYFDCSKCPGYCCSIYERVQVTKRDVNRLAKHFGVSYETAYRRYTRKWDDERVLKRTPDPVLGESCQFLDPVKRNCTIYESRPAVCREYPARSRCVYYDMIKFERWQQDDVDALPLVQISFRETKKKQDANTQAGERVWVWTPEKP